jgi:hypothetical protein
MAFTATSAPMSEARYLVVIGFAEALAAPEVVWSLVDAGFDVAAFARRGKPAALAHSRHVKVLEITAPETDLQTSQAELEALLAALRSPRHAHHVLLPLDDSALWLCGRVARHDGWTLAGAQGAALELALNKQRQTETACAAGFAVPATSVATGAGDLPSACAAFPLILRPADAVQVRGKRLRKGRNWICSDERELAAAQAAWAGDGALLVQPFMEGAGEGVFGLMTERGVVAWSAHRRLRMMNPHGSGSSACISQGVAEALKAPVTAFLASVGWRGMFMIELLRTADDRVWFIEFNGRAWGSMSLARRRALEYPAWTVKLAIDRHATPEETTPTSEEVVCRHLGRELMHLLFVLRGRRSSAIRNWPSFASAMRDVLRFDRRSSFYNWRRGDWRVFVSDCFYTIARNLSKSRGT